MCFCNMLLHEQFITLNFLSLVAMNLSLSSKSLTNSILSPLAAILLYFLARMMTLAWTSHRFEILRIAVADLVLRVMLLAVYNRIQHEDMKLLQTNNNKLCMSTYLIQVLTEVTLNRYRRGNVALETFITQKATVTNSMAKIYSDYCSRNKCDKFCWMPESEVILT